MSKSYNFHTFIDIVSIYLLSLIATCREKTCLRGFGQVSYNLAYETTED